MKLDKYEIVIKVYRKVSFENDILLADKSIIFHDIKDVIRWTDNAKIDFSKSNKCIIFNDLKNIIAGEE